MMWYLQTGAKTCASKAKFQFIYDLHSTLTDHVTDQKKIKRKVVDNELPPTSFEPPCDVWAM
jgi:hypothetical protein